MSIVSHSKCYKCREIKHELDLVESTEIGKLICKENTSCEENRLKNKKTNAATNAGFGDIIAD